MPGTRGGHTAGRAHGGAGTRRGGLGGYADCMLCVLCRFGEEPDIGIPEFLEILGGCRLLGLPGIWFSWASRVDLIAAWRHVGINANRIDTSEIDRANFIDRMAEEEEAGFEQARQTRQEREGRAPDPHSTPISLADALATPLGFHPESTEALKIKLARVTKWAQHLEEVGFDPSLVPGLVQPKEPEKKKRERDRSRVEQSEGGSARLRNLYGKAVEKRQVREKEEEEKEERRKTREEKKRNAEEAEKLLRQQFERCGRGCVCGVDPCPVKGLKMCGVCGEIKQRACGKRACKEAGQPLMLTYVPGDEAEAAAAGQTTEAVMPEAQAEPEPEPTA